MKLIRAVKIPKMLACPHFSVQTELHRCNNSTFINYAQTSSMRASISLVHRVYKFKRTVLDGRTSTDGSAGRDALCDDD